MTRASVTFTDPNFRWTKWTASVPVSAEHDAENPLFTSRSGQFGFQLQRVLDEKKHQNVILRYTLTQTGLSQLLIPQLVATADLHTRLSTLSGTYIRDTRDSPLDTPKGSYESVELDLNPRALRIERPVRKASRANFVLSHYFLWRCLGQQPEGWINRTVQWQSRTDQPDILLGRRQHAARISPERSRATKHHSSLRESLRSQHLHADPCSNRGKPTSDTQFGTSYPCPVEKGIELCNVL